MAPTRQQAFHAILDPRSRFPSLDAIREERVVIRLGVPEVSANRQPDRLFIEPASGAGTPHSSRIFRASVLRNDLGPPIRATREHLADAAGKIRDVGQVELAATARFPFLAADPDIRIGETLLLSPSQCVLPHQEPLPFVLFTRPAPLQDDGSKLGVLARATGQGRITSREVDEMIEVGAREAERTTFTRQRDPGVSAESFMTLIARRIAMSNEHFQLEPIT